jgi:hypothetical protein
MIVGQSCLNSNLRAGQERVLFRYPFPLTFFPKHNRKERKDSAKDRKGKISLRNLTTPLRSLRLSDIQLYVL